jgi:hypothetical protein
MPVIAVQRDLVMVFPFKVFDIGTDDFKPSTRWATKEFIEGVGGRIDGAATKVDRESLEHEGLTARGFTPPA